MVSVIVGQMLGLTVTASALMGVAEGLMESVVIILFFEKLRGLAPQKWLSKAG